MTPREKREMLTDAVIDDILSRLSDDDLGIIRDALADHFAHWRYEEIENEYKERALS